MLKNLGDDWKLLEEVDKNEEPTVSHGAVIPALSSALLTRRVDCSRRGFCSRRPECRSTSRRTGSSPSSLPLESLTLCHRCVCFGSTSRAWCARSLSSSLFQTDTPCLQLTNLGALPTARIHTTLNMLVSTYKGRTKDELQAFLEAMQTEGLLEKTGKSWKIVR